MKLSLGAIHDLYVGLNMLERDEKLKLIADVRIKIAVNISRLKPLAAAYERAGARARADLQAANRELEGKAQRSDAELAADFADINEDLRNKVEDVDLKTFVRKDLRLDENDKIGGITLAQLLPIIDGLE